MLVEQYDKLEKIPGKKLAIGNFYGNSNNSIILSFSFMVSLWSCPLIVSKSNSIIGNSGSGAGGFKTSTNLFSMSLSKIP